MKYVLLLIGVFLCFVLGYLMEPRLRSSLSADRNHAGSEPPAAEETVQPEPEF